MNIGGAFLSAWNSATEDARKSAAAIATGAEKVASAIGQGAEDAKEAAVAGVDAAADRAGQVEASAKRKAAEIVSGVQHGLATAKNKAIDAVDWAADKTGEAEAWAKAKGAQAVQLAKKTAQAVKESFVKVAKEFGAAVKNGLAIVGCQIGAALSPLVATKAPEDPPPKNLAAAKADLQKAENRQQLGLIAADVYNKDSKLPAANQAGDSKNSPLRVAGPVGAVFEDTSSGFKACLYQLKDGSYALAFEGTEPTHINDWLTNLEQGIGITPTQYKEAIALTKEVKAWAQSQGEGLQLTGHSLGGGLATLASMKTGAPATVFNAARVSQSVMDENHVSLSDANLVENNCVDGDLLTGAQDHVEGIGTAIGGAPLAAFGSYEIGTPVGGQRSLPAVDPNGTLVDYYAANALDRHGMDYVQNGLDKQVNDLQTTVGAFSSGSGALP
ncbi:MAG: DUF2974 domain-containing protein [Bryobacteraceae bacterium]|nr:DUF2974 domain-containing protein [Bryobacteraceae bacterium]